MTGSLLATIVFLLVLGAASPARAASFHFELKFAVGPYQPDGGAAGEGTPTGLSLSTAGHLMITDSLDDQIYEVDANGSLVRGMPMDPFCATVMPACAPGTKSALFAADIARDPVTGNLYVIDDRPSGEPSVLNLIDPDGVHLNDWDVTASVALPGGLAIDPRNGDVLASDLGLDSIIRFGPSPGGPFVASYDVSAAGAPAALVPFDDAGTFLVVDSALGKVFEYELPAGPGPSTLLGESTLSGFDLATAHLLGGAFDPLSRRLYLSDDNDGGRVLVYSVAPEPTTVLLIVSALAPLLLLALPGRRHRHYHRHA